MLRLQMRWRMKPWIPSNHGTLSEMLMHGLMWAVTVHTEVGNTSCAESTTDTEGEPPPSLRGARLPIEAATAAEFAAEFTAKFPATQRGGFGRRLAAEAKAATKQQL